MQRSKAAYVDQRFPNFLVVEPPDNCPQFTEPH